MPAQPVTNIQTESKWVEFGALLGKGALDEAELIASVASLEHPADPRWQLGRAWVHMKKGQLTDALHLAEMASKRDPNQAAPYRTVARILLHLKKPTAALDAAEMAFQLDPSSRSRELLRYVQSKTQDRSPTPMGRDTSDIVPMNSARNVDDEVFAEIRTVPQSIDASPGLAPQLEKQLHAFYGIDLFGDWQASVSVAPYAAIDMLQGQREKASRLILALVAVALVAAIAFIVSVALRRSDARKGSQAVVDIRNLLAAGAYPALAVSVPVPQDNQPVLAKSFGAVEARAHATLYREYDGEPRRLTMSELLLRNATHGYDAVVARALLLPRAERVALERDLRRADTVNNEDPQASRLLAEIAATKGKHGRADRLFERTERLQPSHLPHLLAMIEFYDQRERRILATNLREQMNNVDPNSPYTRLARARGAPRGQRARQLAALLQPTAGVAPAAKVLEGWALLQLATISKDPRTALERAASHVDNDPRLVVDFADWLLAWSRPDLAATLAKLKGWPRKSEHGTRAKARIARQANKPQSVRDRRQRRRGR